MSETEYNEVNEASNEPRKIFYVDIDENMSVDEMKNTILEVQDELRRTKMVRNEYPAEVDESSNEPQKFFKSNSFEELYISILKELKTNPEYKPTARDIGTHEITNLTFELTDPKNRLVWNKAREVNYEFAMKFFLWMLNGDTDFSYLSGANKHAKEFIDSPKDEGNNAMPSNFSTAYGPRIHKQLPYIIEELTRDKESRRAVIHVLNEGDLDMLGTDTKEEYPCADSFTFMIRDNKLHMYTHMRSNNMVLTICYDVYNMTMFHEFLFNTLKKVYPELELGNYHHNIVSAHYFKREQELVDKVLASDEVGMIQKQRG